MKDVVYKEWCRTARETIKLPAKAIFRDESDEEPAMGMAGSDGRFSNGDADVPPPKRASAQRTYSLQLARRGNTRQL